MATDRPDEAAEVERDEAREALMGLMDRYERSLCTYLTTLLGDRDLALDCAQETFITCYQHLAGGKQVNARWLYTVARNRAITELRRRQRLQPHDDGLENIPDTRVSEWGGEQAVRRALAALSQEDREVLYLFSVDRLKTEEIAGILGIRATAVRMRLTRARQRFRRIYGDGT